MSVDLKQSHLGTFGAFIDQQYAPWASKRGHKNDKAALLKSNFADWLEEPLSHLNAWRIESWRRDRLEESTKPSTINKQLKALDQCLRKAVEWQVIERNPLQDLRPEKMNAYFIELFAGGTGHSCLRGGWAGIGINWTWTLGQRSVIELPGVTADDDFVLRLSIAGIVVPKVSPFQRIFATVNETQVGLALCRGSALFEFFVPAPVLNLRERVEVALNLPDARRPIDYLNSTDTRFLALQISKVELRPLATNQHKSTLRPLAQDSIPGFLEQRAALQEMVSLGFNCELGFVQRWVGAEPMSLFRWSYSPLEKLVVALQQQLAGLGGRDELEFQVDERGEFVVEDKVYGFRHHTFANESQGSNLQRVKRNEYIRVGVLRKTLLEELRNHSKLFVYHDADKSQLEDIRDLVGALNTYGSNTLLWITSALDESQIGTAEHLEPGLIRGYVSGFQQGSITDRSPHLPSWVAATCHAHGIWSANRKSQEKIRFLKSLRNA